jgi:membrane associated rhomboid family serine protease
LFIIPWKVDVPQERLPLANWFLIIVIIGFFVWQIIQVRQYHQSIGDELDRISAQQKENEGAVKIDPFKGLVLEGWTAKGLLGHIWLHSGWIHLIGNMLFLWIFGNAVCAKIGNIAYPLIYLMLGIAAGASHLLLSGGSAVGASGAINGVIAMYLVFFPTNSIVFFWSPLGTYWGRSEATGFWIILVWCAYDILGVALGAGQIAYFAHIGGFAAGFVIAIILLKTKLIKMALYEKSLPNLFSQMRSKPKLKKGLFYERVLMQDYSGLEQEPAAAPAETKQIPQSPLSEDDFFRQPEPVPLTEPLPAKSNAPPCDGFIRFYCTCGKRCKIPVEYAGKTGKCPQCKQPLKIPKL